MTTRRTAVGIVVQPWFADHCFMGKTVLPAVETMHLLAGAVAESHPDIDIRVMADGRFSRFLEIPEGSACMEAMVECRENADGSILATLLSRRRFKAVTRLQEHGSILFPAARETKALGPAVFWDIPDAPERNIPVEQVYQELVPFGPGYRTLRGTLHLSGPHAWGVLKAPDLRLDGRARESLGSPFPLDGAFHAACVLGQLSADFVPFPVGFARRVVIHPTQPGRGYRTMVKLLSRTRDELLFDLNIVDDAGEVHETLTGLRMRDVSGGTIKPPPWLKEGHPPPTE